MAIPGETLCRPVAACGTSPWGDIPDEPNAQYVDGSFTGSFHDGSKSAPWTTITQGIEAAAQGGLVAVASGTYVEDLDLKHKSLRLVGRCPD